MLQTSAGEQPVIQSEQPPRHVHTMTPEEVRARIIELAFDGDEKRFELFCEELRKNLPEGTSVAVRGSAVTAQRWEDGAPFDADGKGTSDIDVTLIGEQVMACWEADGFYIPALHTKPLCDGEPNFAPQLEPLRQRLQEIARRPVSFQATNNWVLYVRDILLDQPYFMLIEAPA